MAVALVLVFRAAWLSLEAPAHACLFTPRSWFVPVIELSRVVRADWIAVAVILSFLCVLLLRRQ